MDASPINVLMIGPARSVKGGISAVVNNYYAAGLDRQVNLTYIGTMEDGSKLRKLIRAGLAYVEFRRKLGSADIVHVNVASDVSFVRKGIFIRLAKKKGKKILIHQHGGDFVHYYANLSAKQKAKTREVLAMGDAFLVLASPWKTFFGKLIGPERITVFPDAIAVPEQCALRDFRRAKRQILFLGRICKAKGIEELLEAMTKIHETDPDVKLILGGVFEDASLKEKVLQCKEFVTYVGWVSGKTKEELLHRCGYFVLPSYFEGQSLSILEAMAHGCAIVASDTGGIPMMIWQEQTGLLVPPKDAAALEQALRRILTDAELSEKLALQAYAKAKEEFSLQKNMEKLVQIYNQMV